MVEDRQPRATTESSLTAIASTPVTHGSTHTLSATDHAMGMHSLHLIFYYHESPFGPSSDLFDDPAWTALAEALSLYLPVTGRLIRLGDGRWEVKCNDAGVRTIRAKVGDTTVGEWLKTASAVDEKDLAVWEDLPEDPHIWSPFRIQFNDFEQGGMAIGLSCTHLLADLASASGFIKTWTDIHRHDPIEHPPIPLNPNRAPPVPNPGLNPSHNYYKTKSHEITQPITSPINMVTATFSFSNLAIKEQILEAKKTRPELDPFDYLCSLFWTRIRCPGPANRDHSISVCMDFRKLLSIPPEQFGNFLHFFPVSIPDEEFSLGMGHVAGIVHDRIGKLGQEDFWSASEWLESNREKRFTMYGPELTFVNMEHVPVYDAVFEGNKRPVHVSCHVGGVSGEGLIMVLPSPEGGGFARTVTVVLPEKDMARVCEDQEMVKLKPKILLKGDHM